MRRGGSSIEGRGERGGKEMVVVMMVVSILVEGCLIGVFGCCWNPCGLVRIFLPLLFFFLLGVGHGCSLGGNGCGGGEVWLLLHRKSFDALPTANTAAQRGHQE